ncbi:MAG: ABC transporter ATP-binding protein [Planctomycetes bacterium]|nr:ABC transporter ATP-binding protein [Planctomycetota bacterium]
MIAESATTPVLEARQVRKTYRRGAIATEVLKGVDLTVARGEFLSVVGASGSGKSTLLHLLGTLDQADGGEVRLDGERIDNAGARRRDRLRNQAFGFIFQFYHLLPELSALENVLTPLYIASSAWAWPFRRADAVRRARALLERVGLGHRLDHKPRELSGGEMQRAAIARALISGPRVLLADEPTGNLDEDAGAEIARLLRALNAEEGLTIIMVTHNLDMARSTDRVVRLTHGRVDLSPTVLGNRPAPGGYHSPNDGGDRLSLDRRPASMAVLGAGASPPAHPEVFGVGHFPQR